MSKFVERISRIIAAAAVAVSGYIHAELYANHGYRYIHVIGAAFLLQASAGFAVALLLVVTDSAVIRLGAIGVVVGALSGFFASRTIGVAGFTEHGFTPSPEAALSVFVEGLALGLLVATEIRRRHLLAARRVAPYPPRTSQDALDRVQEPVDRRSH